jgi:hypothetical protein
MAMPVSAGGNGATTFTQTFKGPFQAFHVDAACGAPAGMISGSGNGVFHITINKAGDFWLTTTQEANFLFVADDPTLPNFAGHFAAWFGISDNLANSVIHSITNVNATATDGSGATVNLHIVDHISVSASGQVNMFMACH